MVPVNPHPILAAIQAGDPTAWGRAYTEYRERMYSAAFGVLRDHHDTLDAVQEAMWSVMTSSPATLAQIQNLGAYLARTAYHKAIDLIRWNEHTQATDPEDVIDLTAEEVDVEEVAGDRVALEAAADVLDHMPDNVRYAYVQRVLMARKAKDVAVELGCTPQYIAQLVSAAVTIIDEFSPFIKCPTSDPSSPAPSPGTTKDGK